MDYQNANVETIDAVVVTDIAKALRDTEALESVIKNEWHGNAPEQFVANLTKAKEKMVDAMFELKKTFKAELQSVQARNGATHE